MSDKTKKIYRITGRVIDIKTRQGLAGLRVEAWDKDLILNDLVGSAVTDADGAFQIRFDQSYFAELFLDQQPDLFFKVFRENTLLKSTKDSVLWNVRAGKTEIVVEVELADTPRPTVKPAQAAFVVAGKVVSRVSAGVDKLRVEVVDKNVGADVPLAETLTAEDGSYQVAFGAAVLQKQRKQRPDLQARAYAGQAFLGASEVRYNATQNETLNVLLPDLAAAALPSEHETLTGALATYFQGNLGDLQESDKRQDITYLANKTGWDARAVALAALADQFSRRSGPANIPPAFFYALFRAGLPANEDTLYHADAGTLTAIWQQAAGQGVISKALVESIPSRVAQFQTLSAQKMLSGPALAGASSLKEMLSVSQLDDAQQARFAELYAAHRADLPTFWETVTKSFGDGVSNRLQLDGKLGFLTINNAPLMRGLHQAAGDNGLSDPLQLAQMGYHHADQWSKLLTAEVPIPPEIPGDTPELQRANYADYLAAQVRLSYPTAAVAQMIGSGELDLNLDAKLKEIIPNQIHAFLTEQQGQFEIGVQPIEQYLKLNPQVRIEPEALTHIKRVQRVYQITPGDQAMIGLLKRGIDSAYHVVRYDRETFIQTFQDDLGSPENAALTYDKSVQVHNVVLNIVISYLTASNAPGIGVHSPASIVNPAPLHADDIIAYPTLEKLLGGMDYCDCDECRSILSPAAYLVDLLQFIDQPIHPAGTENPQTVLLERRPDIQYLPLTCENTNTALPYIDVVNETLEYFVANAAANTSQNKPPLDGYVGHDTGDVASADLLANPQFVVDAAYTILRGESFPAPLPFHQPLETLRRYFNKFEVPLPLAMEQLRKSDDLERGGNPYGWRDIWMEELGLSRAEYDLLTTSNADPNVLAGIYGFPDVQPDSEVQAALSNVKQFTRRIEITYDDIVAMLKTRFINPNSDLIPKLERLGISIPALVALHNIPQGITDADFNNLLPPATAPNAIDVTEFGGDKAAWELDNHNTASVIRNWLSADGNNMYGQVMGLITLTLPLETWQASTDYLPGDCVTPTPPPAGSTLYYECATPGKSAASQPAPWPANPGDIVTDGQTQWTCRDVASAASFANFAFRYSDPGRLAEKIGAVEFVRLLRFIRLWKKLGWTIEQTDTAICALFPAQATFAGNIDTVAKLNTGFLTLLPRLGILTRVMTALNLTPKKDLLSLLTCWSDINTHGENALYRQMFLNPTVLQQDDTFADNGYGEFLQDASQMLPADKSQKQVRLAGKITTDDVLTTSINGVDIPYQVVAGDTTVTTLATHIISAINATAAVDPITGLPLNQVILASNASGIITIKSINPDLAFTLACSLSSGATETYAILDHESALRAAFNLTGDEYSQIVTALGYNANTLLTIPNISAIYRRGWLARKLKLSARELLLLTQLTGLKPFDLPDPTNPAILKLIAFAQALKEHSLKPAAALYLVWNQDLSGKSAPDPAQVTGLARALRSAFAAVEAEFAIVDDPDGAIAQARMTLVYGVEATAFFFSLLNNTLVTEVSYSRAQASLITTVPYIRNWALSLASMVSYKHHQAALEALILAAAPGLVYDDGTGQLSFTGDLSPTINALNAAADSAIADNDARKSFKDAVALLYVENQSVISAKLPQPFVDAAPNLAYDEAKQRLALTGALSANTAKALKAAAATAITDSAARGLFESAVDSLYAENQQVTQSNLEQPIVDAASGRIAYDDFRKRLSFSGELTEAIRGALVSAASAITAITDRNAFIAAVGDALPAAGTLFQKSRATIDPFFARYPELRQPYDNYASDIAHTAAEKRSALLSAILPELVKRRKGQQALQSVSAAAQADAAFASAMLDNKLNDQYVLHTSGDVALPALDDLTALETPGLSAQFFYSVAIPNPPSPNLVKEAEANLDYSASGNNELPPNTNPGGGPICGVWSGYLEAPENGSYNLQINADAGATVTVTIDGKQLVPSQPGNVWDNKYPIELRAGNLYAVSIQVEKVTDALSVRWQTTGRGWEVIPARYLYSAALTDHLRNAYI
ncbi:MAG: Tc toxin subunit A, partial [Anaerolineales bacterium]